MPAALIRVFDPQAIAVRTALWLPPLVTAIQSPLDSDQHRADRHARSGWHLRCPRSSCSGCAGRCAKKEAPDASCASSRSSASSHRSPPSSSARSESICCTACGARSIPARGPYGPFVNRNHMATWIIMACPLAFGYLLARAPRKESPHHFSQRVANALKQLGTIRIWLVVAVCVMTLAVMLSASRSGLIGLMSAFAAQHGADTAARRRWQCDAG